MTEKAAGEAAPAGAPAGDVAAEPSAADMAVEGSARLALDEARSLTGQKLDEIGGATVGRIEGVYVDAEGGQPEWLLARMGRFGHYTLVPARDAVGGAGHVWIPYTRDQVRRAPKVDSGSTLSAGQEKQLLSHYGIGTEAGRAAEIANRDDAAVSAKPA